MLIPRIIHQTAPSFDALPADLKVNIERLKRLNPGWEYRFYDNAAVVTHLRKWLKPQGLALVARVNPRYGVVFADLFRYLAIFFAGGAYLDIKSGIDRPLEEMLLPSDHFVLSHWPRQGEEFGGRGLCDDLPNFPRGEFQQWHLIGRPRHPFMLAAARRALINMARYDARRDGTGFMGVLRLAGPICYSLAIEPLLDKAPYRQVESAEIGLRYLIYPEEEHHARNLPHYTTLDEPIMLPGNAPPAALANRRAAANVAAVSEPILDIRGLSKTYTGGVTALEDVDLAISKGEIFALLGPNGAGKTTLIGAVCGLVKPTGGTIRAFGKDVNRHWREVRRKIGLVPQELAFDMFAQVEHSVAYSRGMFGCPPSPERIAEVLRSLSLYDRRKAKIRELSGGMKRRVMIAKALSHDPELLFLDEPTAGVDVELRRDMWKQIGALRDAGTTIILTTHYIEEAQEMADRVGVINKGKLLLVDDKKAIMAKLGRTEARITLAKPMKKLPAALSKHPLTIEDEGMTLVYRGGEDGKGKREAADIIKAVVSAGIAFEGIITKDSSLEDIFVDLVEAKDGLAA